MSVSYRRPVMRPDAVSLTSTGCMVAMSEMVPSMMRPPCCGFSLAAALALALAPGPELADGVPPAQAVATSVLAARAAMRARPVRGWLMVPSLAPFGAYPYGNRQSLAAVCGRRYSPVPRFRDPCSTREGAARRVSCDPRGGAARMRTILERSARQPPALDVAVGREGPRVEPAERPRGDEERRRREAEIVRLRIVQQPVQGVVALLPCRLGAVAVGRRARGLDEPVRVGRAERAEVVSGGPLRGVWDRARMPDAEGIGLDVETPADDPGRHVLGPAAQHVDHRVEGHETRSDAHADLPVLIDHRLEQRLAQLVPRVRHHGDLERLPVLLVDAVRAARESRPLQQILRLRPVVRIASERHGIGGRP